MEIKKYNTGDLAFRFVDGKFYINSQEIKSKSIRAEVQITLDFNDSVTILTCSDKEAEIMVKGKLNYDALEKFEV